MKRLLALLLLVPLLMAARPGPSGSFTVDSIVGREVTFSLHDMRHVTRNDEVTLGTTCVDAFGTQLVMWDTSTNNAGHNPYIYEIHWHGNYDVPFTLTVPDEARACESSLIVADWFKGQVLQAWVLQDWVPYAVP